MMDVSYFGTMMVYTGDADGMVSGAVHTTQHTIRPALQFVKTKPGFSVVSSVFFMCLEQRVLVYGDCAINPNPTAEQLAEIAISSADTARTFGVDPKGGAVVILLRRLWQGEEVEKVRAATKLARERRPDLLLEGPIQYDAAVDPAVGAQKMKGSEVAGKATVLIFPDLNTGNNTYKAVQRETGRHRHWSRAAGVAEAGKRPQPGLHGRRHHQHRGDYGSSGPDGKSTEDLEYR
jgi:phosphate acetyltransferase